jgi:hypothetical protein
MPGTDVAATPPVLDEIKEGIKHGKLAKPVDVFAAIERLHRPERDDVPAVIPTLPPARVLNDKQRAALAGLPEVYGGVTIAERRTLGVAEVKSLLAERMVIDAVMEPLEERLADIRTLLFTHWDIKAEEDGLVDDDVKRDKDGHYILAAEAPVEGQPKKFTREVRGGAAFMNEAKLKALVDDPNSPLTREQYLAITKPVRVYDEGRFMHAVDKDPSILDAIQAAVEPAKKTAAFHTRKA